MRSLSEGPPEERASAQAVPGFRFTTLLSESSAVDQLPDAYGD